jgi:hypothetical protein
MLNFNLTLITAQGALEVGSGIYADHQGEKGGRGVWVRRLRPGANVNETAATTRPIYYGC